MKKQSTGNIPDNPPVKRADIASGRLILRKRGVNGAVLPAKQRINIYIDSAVVEHFKAKAGARGYQTLINESLKEAMRGSRIEETLRKVVRSELAALKKAA